MSAANPFSFTSYMVRRKILVFWHRKFHVYGPNEELVFYTEMKALKLKEDIRVYADENKSRELLIIKARSILDLGATYDVYDATQNVKVGALRRQFLKSMLRDEWSILDPQDQVIGKIQEDSMVMALIRRFLAAIIPQSYTVEIGGQPVALYKQNFNPFVLKLNLDFSADPQGRLDRRLGIGAAVLLCAIDGRQE